jgi:hypothetical protein
MLHLHSLRVKPTQQWYDILRQLIRCDETAKFC